MKRTEDTHTGTYGCQCECLGIHIYLQPRSGSMLKVSTAGYHWGILILIKHRRKLVQLGASEWLRIRKRTSSCPPPQKKHTLALVTEERFSRFLVLDTAGIKHALVCFGGKDWVWRQARLPGLISRLILWAGAGLPPGQRQSALGVEGWPQAGAGRLGLTSAGVAAEPQAVLRCWSSGKQLAAAGTSGSRTVYF